MRVCERLVEDGYLFQHHAVDGEILWNMGHSACELVASRFLSPTELYALAAIQLQSIHTSFLKLYRGK